MLIAFQKTFSIVLKKFREWIVFSMHPKRLFTITRSQRANHSVSNKLTHAILFTVLVYVFEKQLGYFVGRNLVGLEKIINK